MRIGSIHARNLPNRLWLARKRAGYSQKWVRRLLGKRSLATISEYEQGRKMPPLPVALKLAAMYQTTLAELFPDLYASAIRELAQARQALPSLELRDAEVRKAIANSQSQDCIAEQSISQT